MDIHDVMKDCLWNASSYVKSFCVWNSCALHFSKVLSMFVGGGRKGDWGYSCLNSVKVSVPQTLSNTDSSSSSALSEEFNISSVLKRLLSNTAPLGSHDHQEREPERMPFGNECTVQNIGPCELLKQGSALRWNVELLNGGQSTFQLSLRGEKTNCVSVAKLISTTHMLVNYCTATSLNIFFLNGISVVLYLYECEMRWSETSLTRCESCLRKEVGPQTPVQTELVSH